MNTDNEKKYLPIDNAFADFILRRSGIDSNPQLKEVISDLSLAVRSGASCLEIDGEIREKLLTCCGSTVADAQQEKALSFPLILDGNFLYFQKLYKLEENLAELFCDIACRPVPEASADTLDDIFSTMPQSEGVAKQKAAVRNALTHSLAVICGGPGTGKTTVASALLCQELQRKMPNGKSPSIALLAPTGKAYVRLRESLLEDSKKFNIPQEIRSAFETLPGGTIHRFLGWGNQEKKYNKDNPVPFDLILVDECSMISLDTMYALLSALPGHARVVLLGDDAQLSSIDAGLVFSDLCTASEKSSSGPLCGIVSALVFNFRAQSAPQLINLAENLRAGRLPDDVEIKATPKQKDFAAEFPEFIKHFREISRLCSENKQKNIEEAFRLLDDHKMICPVNLNTKFGTAGINAAVLSALDADESSPGVPIMIRHNNYDLELFNGDTGLIVKDKKAVFPGKSEAFPLAALPEYDISYAITAHKSQGSGYKQISLLLPDEELPLVNRALIYTAVTRARECARIFGRKELVLSALENRNNRASGLAVRLLKRCNNAAKTAEGEV